MRQRENYLPSLDIEAVNIRLPVLNESLTESGDHKGVESWKHTNWISRRMTNDVRLDSLRVYIGTVHAEKYHVL